MGEYSPAKWYWLVEGNSTQVFSGALLSYVALSDATYEAWLAAGNTPSKISSTDLAQIIGEIALGNGIHIESTGAPALNGSYSIDAEAQQNINAVITYILLNGTFPGAATTMAWADAVGGMHVFPSVAEFKAYATAVADYVAAIEIYANSGGSIGSLPASPVTIS